MGFFFFFWSDFHCCNSNQNLLIKKKKNFRLHDRIPNLSKTWIKGLKQTARQQYCDCYNHISKINWWTLKIYSRYVNSYHNYLNSSDQVCNWLALYSPKPGRRKKSCFYLSSSLEPFYSVIKAHEFKNFKNKLSINSMSVLHFI